jgi:outer membrane protein
MRDAAHYKPAVTVSSRTIGHASLRAALSVAASVLCLWLASPVQSETLQGALAAAYQYNPQLDAERARLRATDEGVAQAEGQFRPTITGNGSIGYQNSQTRSQQNANPLAALLGGNPGGGQVQTNDTFHPKNVGVTVTQPIFRGFRTINGINVAEANVRAGRETLRNTEQTILIGAITAYMDTVRDQAILKLRENNRKVLADTLKSTQDQFKVGEVTRTDVAQAEATLAGAVSAIDLARANLAGSRANYERFIGRAPSQLVEPKPLKGILPKTVNDAAAISAQEAPAVVSALYQEQGARFNVDLIRGELLPTLQVQGTYNDSFEPSRTVNESRVATVTGQLTVPIYEQGIVYSRVRQAKHTHLAALQEIQRTKSEAQAAAISAFSQHQAVRAQLSSDQTAVESNRIALAGVREEEKVGQRTKLDVLNAEQTYLNAQVNLVTTRRNVIVNDYTLLQAIGRLNILELAAVPVAYDPEEHYFEIRRKWWGLDITHTDGHRERLETWHTVGQTHESMK